MVDEFEGGNFLGGLLNCFAQFRVFAVLASVETSNGMGLTYQAQIECLQLLRRPSRYQMRELWAVAFGPGAG